MSMGFQGRLSRGLGKQDVLRISQSSQDTSVPPQAGGTAAKAATATALAAP